ncbi:MAG: flagellin, partial [Selenomonadaceae bacterium]|nr:flagellin [Selenomonadaceae bacterium]
MAMVVKNNLSAVRTLNQLNQNNSELNKRLAKVASGMKINSAGDDASGYSISERMRVQIRSLDQDLQNVQNGSAMLKTASGGVEDILNILRTMKEKAIDAANDSNTDEDRQTIQKEITQLRHTINDVALGNEYNGKRLLDGRYDQKIKYVDAATTAVQVATSLMTSLNKTTLSGTAALDEAISSASNGKFSTTSALVENFLSDLDSSTSATAFLSDYCGIILNNTDTGAITGADAGGDTVKTAESIVPEQVAVSSWGLPTSATTIDGLTITWPTADADGTTLTTAEEHILKGLNSDWIEQSLKLVKESYGIDFNDPDATIKTISVNFFNSNTTTDPDLQSHGSSLAFVRHWSSGGNATKLELYVNMKYYNSIDTSSEDGATSDPSAGYLDRTLAHEFTHAVMAANIYSFKDLPMYLKEGTAELVHGIDDERGSGFANLLTTDRSTLERIFSDGGTSADGEKPYSAGYMLLRYLAK